MHGQLFQSWDIGSGRAFQMQTDGGTKDLLWLLYGPIVIHISLKNSSIVPLAQLHNTHAS